MNKIFFYLTLGILTFQESLNAQINKSNFNFNNIPIECYKYKIENKEVILSYIDKKTKIPNGEIENNFGKTNYNLIFDSIYKYLQIIFPKVQVSLFSTDLNVTLIDFNENLDISTNKNLKVHNHFWIGAINFYQNKLDNHLLTDTNYFKLAESIIKFDDFSIPSDRIISYLESSIKLNNKYTAAYLLLAKVYKQNAVMKGMISASNPYQKLIDQGELKKATSILNELLKFDKNKEAIILFEEIDKMKSK